jgi:hypothetical protein
MVLIIIEHSFSEINKLWNNLKENVKFIFPIPVDSIVEIQWDVDVLFPI